MDVIFLHVLLVETTSYGGYSTLNELQDTSEWVPLNVPADVPSEGWVEPSGDLPRIL